MNSYLNQICYAITFKAIIFVVLPWASFGDHPVEIRLLFLWASSGPLIECVGGPCRPTDEELVWAIKDCTWRYHWKPLRLMTVIKFTISNWILFWNGYKMERWQVFNIFSNLKLQKRILKNEIKKYIHILWKFVFIKF